MDAKNIGGEKRADPTRRGVAADRIHSAAIHLLRHLRKQDVVMGLSPARASVLSILVFGGPRTLGELAAAEQVRPPTITRLTRGMEAAGLVRRAVDTSDRRIVRLHATAKGKRLLSLGRQRRLSHLTAKMKRLDTRQVALIEEAAGILERLARQE